MRVNFVRWIIKGAAFTASLAATAVLLLYLLPSNQESYLAALIDKHEILESTPSPRVIVVGGSNIAYGLDSELLASLLNVPVVNDGLHAGLGMRFMLNDLVPFLRPGDIVVIAPEYEHFFGETLEGGDTLGLLLDVYPQAVLSFKAPQYAMLPGFYTTMLRSRIARLTYPLLGLSEEEGVIYSRSAFNQYGDVTSHLGQPPNPHLEVNPYIEEFDIYNPAAVEVLNQFAGQGEAIGVVVYLVYPASRSTDCAATQPRMDELDERLRQHLVFPVLSQPGDSCFPDAVFFDTQYHMVAEGRQLFTQMLAGLLIDQALGK